MLFGFTTKNWQWNYLNLSIFLPFITEISLLQLLNGLIVWKSSFLLAVKNLIFISPEFMSLLLISYYCSASTILFYIYVIAFNKLMFCDYCASLFQFIFLHWYLTTLSLIDSNVTIFLQNKLHSIYINIIAFKNLKIAL